MFERLAGKLLSRLLSKYFVSNDASTTTSDGTNASPSKKSTSSQLGVWSGYVSLEGLELRKEVVNRYFRSEGLPFELLQCTVGRVEITVPWAKLGRASAEEDVVVVVVLDGIHALFRTNYEFDDASLRENSIQQRRQELLDSETFGKDTSNGGGSFFQKYIAQGILKDVVEKLHLHIRDVHVRLEDVQSDPANPCACGITLESLHVQQADDEEHAVDKKTSTEDATIPETVVIPSPSEVIRKVAQLNHLAIYWNALDYGEGLPTELSILQDTMHSSASLANALDRCITRRATSLSSPLRKRPAQSTPNHAFLLLPLDATLNATLSTDPSNLELRPALVASLRIDSVGVQLRDFQCSQISVLAQEAKEHLFAKDYRKYRPLVSAKDNPRAWWMYAIRIIRMELCLQGSMRWSWSRFHERYALRRRYCELYERKRRHSAPQRSRSSIRRTSIPPVASIASIPSQDSDPSSSIAPDKGAGPSKGGANGGTSVSNGNTQDDAPLTLAERNELKEMEDGVRGDLSVHDIVAFRALVNARVAGDKSVLRRRRMSAFRRFMGTVVSDDIESEEEYKRLLAYLEQTGSERESEMSSDRVFLVAVTFETHLDRGCITFFSPLRSTEDLNQHCRIQQRFLDISMIGFHSGYSVLGNYETFQLQASIEDFVGSEIRSNMTEHSILSRFVKDNDQWDMPEGSEHGTPQASNRDANEKKHLVQVDLHGSSPDSSDCDLRVHAVLQAIEILLLPDGEWFRKVEKLVKSIPSKTSLSSFWEEISMVQINALDSGRAGLLAKADTALYKHKNIDLDLFLDCPVLRITDGKGSTLTIDLGRAHLTTERLAGVATGKLHKSWNKSTVSSAPRQNGALIVDGHSVDANTSHTGSSFSPLVRSTPNLPGALGEPTSPRRDLDRSFLDWSAMSVMGNRTVARSIRSGSAPFADADSGGDEYSSHMLHCLHSSFYDEFRLEFGNACMFMSEENGARQSSLMDSLSVQAAIEKSVIPSDHTLCRLKTQCQIGDVKIRLTDSSSTCLIKLLKRWAEAYKSEPSVSPFYVPSVATRASKVAIRSDLPIRSAPEAEVIEETTSDASSVLDENEFMDALEGDDQEDSTGAWFDDNWIADAESVVESETTPSVPQVRRRRRQRAMSDVSSISDRSWGRRAQATDHYLSAENLARLEERRTEDEDLDDSDAGSDADSFHSALSLGGQEELAKAVEEDIGRAERDILEIKKNIAAEAKSSDEPPSSLEPAEIKRRRKKRRKLRTELDRAEAELRALRATHTELATNVESVKTLGCDKLEANDANISANPDLRLADDSAARAKALLRSRRQRSSPNESGEAFVHGLTSGLNRELLRMSVVVSKVTLSIEAVDCSSEEKQDGEASFSACYDFCLTQCATVLLQRAHETRLYASVDHTIAAMRESHNESGLFNRQLFLGGVKPSLLDTTVETLLSPEGKHVTVSPENKFIRLSVDRQNKFVSGRQSRSSAQTTKLKLHVGDIEVSPKEQSLSSLTNFCRNLVCIHDGSDSLSTVEKQTTPSSAVVRRLCEALSGVATSDGDHISGKRKTLEYTDISLNLSSLQVNLNTADDTVGSLVLTAVGVRFLRGLTGVAFTHRAQADMRCNNAQILERKHGRTTLELLGRRDPYNPIAQLRVRTQLAPLDHSGGWVVGEKTTEVSSASKTVGTAWNMHIGAKFNSIYATVFSEPLHAMWNVSQSLKRVFQSGHPACLVSSNGKKADAPLPATHVMASTLDSTVQQTADIALVPIRWRADVSSTKISIVFPAQDISDSSNSVRGNILFTFSLRALSQPAEQKTGQLSICSNFSDISISRTSDDWPLIEPTSVACKIITQQNGILRACSCLRLKVPETFSWCESRMSSSGEATRVNKPNGSSDLSYSTLVTVSMSPVRCNLTTQTCCLLQAALSALEKPENSFTSGTHDQENSAILLPEARSSHELYGCRLDFSAESFELKLLRESARSSNLSFADPLSSLASTGVRVSYSSTGERDEAMVMISEITVDDLSSLPGVRVFDMDGGEERAPRARGMEWNGSEQAKPRTSTVFSLSRDKQENSVDIQVQLGRIQCLLLPSILQSILTFKREMRVSSGVNTEPIKAENSVQPKRQKRFSLPLGAQQLRVSFEVSGFECILSSRDVLAYIRSRSSESISVVSIRLKSSISGNLSQEGDKHGPDVPGLFERPGSPCPSDNDAESLSSAMIGQSQSASCTTGCVQLSVEDVQVLRTNVKRRPFPRTAAGDTHVSPYCFAVIPPFAGEQRITNPFWFNVSYQLAVASQRQPTGDGPDNRSNDEEQTGSTEFQSVLSISHSLKVDAGLVDVLVYIKQSDGGMNDAVRVTVKPMLDLLQRSEDTDLTATELKDGAKDSGFADIFKDGTAICSLQSEGLQVTCVPGGATRLTESPIAKCELSSLRIGLVAVSVPADLKFSVSEPASHISAIERLRQAGLERFGVVEPVITGGPGSHLTMGGWMQSELSASYHNRRLVAWEPFVEPWVVKVRVGVDLVRAFGISPTQVKESSTVAQDKGVTSCIIGEGKNETAGERIRDIGRLLRSPFSPDPVASKNESPSESRVELTPIDMSYAVMKSIAPHIVTPALYPEAQAGKVVLPLGQMRAHDFGSLPGTDPVKWLELFGYPPIANRSDRRESAAVLCSISDSQPLNVNLTGALIENVIGFVGGKQETSHPIAPHLIRNLSGLTVRFQECLDAEQLRHGESTKKTTLSNGCEIPLTLKRSISQSCDPHRAFILLELGSFEDTAGRINHHDYDIPTRSRSTIFFYNAMGKIPVDTVGVHKYALRRRFERRAGHDEEATSALQNLGNIIVRVCLQGATKVVSIESPLILQNNSEVNLLCELRDNGGISLLWRSLVPKVAKSEAEQKKALDKKKFVPVPADLVSVTSSTEAAMSVCALTLDSLKEYESLTPSPSENQFEGLEVPPPFSEKSVSRGLIKVFETNLRAVSGAHRNEHYSGERPPSLVNLNTCAVRIGSLRNESASLADSTNMETFSSVPEQRMLLFRPPVVFRNHLPVAIVVQARVKKAQPALRRLSTTGLRGIEMQADNAAVSSAVSAEWHDLGNLECGQSVSWTGATAGDRVEMRIRLNDDQSEYSRRFMEWSTPLVVPSETDLQRSKRPGKSDSFTIGQMEVLDETQTKLRLSVLLEFGSAGVDSSSSPREDVSSFALKLPAAPRVVGFYVPFWVIDSTSQDLEFLSNTVIAGQSSRFHAGVAAHGAHSWWDSSHHEQRAHLGLAELLEDETLRNFSARPSFNVLMIGDEKSTRLTVRRRMTRLYDDASSIVSSWCDPINLRASENSSCDVSVPPPSIRWGDEDLASEVSEPLDPLALRVRVIRAPKEFGGSRTKLLHLVNRYRIVNKMGREIELISEYGKGLPTVVGVDGSPTAFHFDGTSPIRFRPKEFGWAWSGRFSMRKKRRELSVRLVHKLKGQVIIAEVEFVEGKNCGGNILVFRQASHPPFRLENQTMQALHFGQSSVVFSSDILHPSAMVSLDSTLLPYHHAEYAWDEPDHVRRSLMIEISQLGTSGDHVIQTHRTTVGRFDLDRMAPGTEVRLSNPMYSGHILADGPTRVLRITDSSLPPLPSDQAASSFSNDVFRKPESETELPSLIELKLSHGIGISIVDWSPQELLYVQFDDITMERRVDSEQQKLTFEVSCISVDNQLWVTPFPVLLRMGRRTRSMVSTHLEKPRRRRNHAIAVSWLRTPNNDGGLTLVDGFELSTEPIILCMDGYLAELLWKMAGQIAAIREGVGGAPAETRSLDTELRKVLRIGESRHYDPNASLASRRRSSWDASAKDLDDRILFTTAVASKLRLRRRSGSTALITNRAATTKPHSRQSPLPEKRSKYYVGKWKVSTVKTEVSWSGPLPGAFVNLPGVMRPALTFESLPVMLRPFSGSHAYGTFEDLLNGVKSHYLSIWRVVDVLVGLTFRPTFLIRACIYTWRESCASVFDSISNLLGGVEKELVRLAEPTTSLPIMSDASRSIAEAPQNAIVSSRPYQIVVGGSLLATASFFHNSAKLTSAISSTLRYGGSQESSSRNPASGWVRARNPRLFAHVDGKELLVEYVEGESAGKAILSRVRMGRHLGEGYVFHCEDVHLETTKSQTKPLICMVTSERVFLLNGDRHVNFCSVVWESTLLNLVELEIDDFDGAVFDRMKLWYLVDRAHAAGNVDDRLTRYAKAIVGDTDWGLDVLLCKSILVPEESAKVLRSRIAAVHKSLDDLNISSDSSR